MNKRGQLAFLGVMLFVMMFIAVIILINPIKEQITLARDADHLDCANTSISDGTKMTCIVVDWTFPIYIGTGFAVALGFIGLRRLTSGGDTGGS
jgi:hypothetical protein